MKHTLNYIREATQKKDGLDGFLYIHHWPTGWQELIFKTHGSANKYIKKINNEINTATSISN